MVQSKWADAFGLDNLWFAKGEDGFQKRNHRFPKSENTETETVTETVAEFKENASAIFRRERQERLNSSAAGMH